MGKMISFAEKPMGATLEKPGQTPKPYFPSMSVPIKAFSGVPEVGSMVNLEIMGEIVEVRKTDRGTEVRIEVKQGMESNSDAEFEEMDPEKQTKHLEKEYDEQTADIEEMGGKEKDEESWTG